MSTVQEVLLFVQRLGRASLPPVGCGEEPSSGEKMERGSFLSRCFSPNALCALLADLSFNVIAPPPFFFFLPFLLPASAFWPALPQEEPFGTQRGSRHVAEHPSRSLPAPACSD